jgi:hypothetical protein
MGSLGGGAIGNMFGHGAEGKDLGRNLGATISKWLGTGDYTVKMNTLVHSSANIPMMHRTGQSIIVRHKEFVCDVIAGTGTPTKFTVSNSFYLNPGLATSFPWLSTIAQQFQEYTWRGVVYHYVPTSGSTTTSQALGSVMLHTDYRVTAPAPNSKVELLNEYFASDAKPAEGFCHPIECDPKENPYNVQYIRSSSVPSGEDPKSYDLGKVNLATVGVPAANTNLGELWVTYEVELRKPQLGAQTASTSYAYSTLAPSVTDVLGTPTMTFNDLAISISADGKTVTFPKGVSGVFLILYRFYSAGSASLAYTSRTLTNCTDSNPAHDVRDPAYSLMSGTTDGFLTHFVQITDPSSVASVTTTFGTMTNIANASLIVTKLSPSWPLLNV